MSPNASLQRKSNGHSDIITEYQQIIENIQNEYKETKSLLDKRDQEIL